MKDVVTKKCRGMRVVAAAVVLVLGAAAGSVSAAEPALNVLFYGNSYMNNLGVPNIFANVASRLGGHTKPNVVNGSVNSQALSFHIAVQTSNVPVAPNTTVNHWINDNTLNNNATGKWDFVVLQELSTNPTNIAGNNPAGFKADAQTLFNLVKADTPTVSPVLLETWARHSTSPNYPGFYPSLTAGGSPYYAAATKMQSELRQYYGEARTLLGGSTVGLASVGDAFESIGGLSNPNMFGGNLYNSSDVDMSHEGFVGAFLTALVLYDTVYHDNVSRFTWAQVSANSYWGEPLSARGVGQPEWNILAAAADAYASPAAVPEPTSLLSMLVVGSGVLLRRRRQSW